MTIEDKNNATYLRAYTNWRYQVITNTPSQTINQISVAANLSSARSPVQAEEKSRVGVRMLGHLLRGASQRSVAQMEIIEIPLSERPVAVACCPVTGDLLVACDFCYIFIPLKDCWVSL